MSISETIYEAFHMSLQRETLAIIDEAEKISQLYQSSYAPSRLYEQDAIEDYDQDFLSRFTHHSAAIEGSTLTLRDTALVLEGEFLPQNDTQVRDMFAAKGIAEGYDFAIQAIEQNREIDEEFIKDLHERTALDCQPRARGVYRVTPVYITGSRAIPVAADKVRDAMADLLFAWKASTQPLLVSAAAFHAMFENIHPFRDGNGRTGRTILNVMLQQAGYAPVALKSEHRMTYLASLEAWQVDGKPDDFVKLVATSVIEETKARIQVIKETRRAVSLLDTQKS